MRQRRGLPERGSKRDPLWFEGLRPALQDLQNRQAFGVSEFDLAIREESTFNCMSCGMGS